MRGDQIPVRFKRLFHFVIGLGLLTISLLIASSNTQASPNIYYVSPTGNDNNPGTINNPLRSIQAAADRVKPGDTVYVREGTYVEEVRIDQSGSHGNSIIFKAYQDETPVIDGRAGVDCINCGLPDDPIVEDRIDTKTGRGFNWGSLVNIRGDYVVFEGFVVKRSLGRGIIVWRNNSVVSNVTIKGNQVLDSRSNGILLEGEGTENIRIQDNIVWHSGSYAPWVDNRGSSVADWPAAVRLKNGNQVTVQGNTIYENWGEGFTTRDTTNVNLEDNVFYDNFAAQIYFGRVENLTVQRNLTYHTNNPEWRRGGDPSPCIVINNEDTGAQLISQNIDIINNIAVGCNQNFAIWGNDGLNIVIKNILVSHNIFMNAVTNHLDNVARDVNFLFDQYRDFNFENNIVYQGNTTNGHEVGYAQPGVSYANNLWYPHRPENGYGADPSDVVGQEPQFLDSRAYELPENWSQEPQKDWFKIKSNSPAINQGISSKPFYYGTDIYFDLFMGFRVTNPDMGVHEYGSTSPKVLICRALLGDNFTYRPAIIIQLLDRTYNCSSL